MSDDSRLFPAERPTPAGVVTAPDPAVRRMKGWLRRLVLRSTRRVLPLLEEAQAQALLRQFKSCGSDVRLFPPMCVLGADQIAVGSSVALGAYLHVWGQGGLTIGDRVMIASHVSITTTTHDLNAQDVFNSVLLKPIVIEDDVWIGTHCSILPGVTIGRGAIIGAGAVVTKDVAPNAVIVPAATRLLRMRGVGVPEGPTAADVGSSSA